MDEGPVNEFTLQYPVFFLEFPEGGAAASILNGEKRIPIFASRELAELFIEQTGGNLVVRIVPDDLLLQTILLADESVAGFIWNSPALAKVLCLIDRDAFLQ